MLIFLTNSLKLESKSQSKIKQKPLNEYYTLHFQHSGKCIDVEGNQLHDGAKVLQYDCHGGDNQKFLLQYNSDDNTYYIVNKHSGKVLDIPWPHNTSMPIHQWSLWFGVNQKWILDQTNTGHFRIRSKFTDGSSGKGWCLQVERIVITMSITASSPYNLAKVVNAPCSDSEPGQRIGLVLVETN